MSTGYLRLQGLPVAALPNCFLVTVGYLGFQDGFNDIIVPLDSKETRVPMLFISDFVANQLLE